ncbi:integrase, catalytic region, zinc finger, CCHC-type containing protein [Tanacetum coccineum]
MLFLKQVQGDQQDVPTIQSQLVESTQGTNRTPRADRTRNPAIVIVDDVVSKKKKGNVLMERLVLQEKILEEDIEKMVDGNDDSEATEFDGSKYLNDKEDSGTRLDPGRHKKNLEEVDDDDGNDDDDHTDHASIKDQVSGSQQLSIENVTFLNFRATAQEIGNNVELTIMQGSGRLYQKQEGSSVDEYERFLETPYEIPTHQMNTKFVNNLPAYWGKYVTNVKQNMDISTTPYVQIYTHLKAYEPHAKKTLKKQEQSTSIVDPLAYVAHTTSAPALSSPSTPSPQPTAQSPNDALMATMTQIANLLSGFQKQFPPTNNQLRTSSNSRTHAMVHDGHIVTEPVQRKAPGNNGNTGTRGKKVICYNCRGEGHVARQCTEPKRKMDSQYFKDKALLMEAKEKGDVLDAEAEAFLADVECTAPYDQPKALTTTNMFQANHEDAYDSDVDEGPNAAVAFMANLSSTSATKQSFNEDIPITIKFFE